MPPRQAGPSVFAELGDAGVFRRYRLRLEFRHAIHGGVPKTAPAMEDDPETETMIDQWLKTATRQHERQATTETMKAALAAENTALIEAAQEDPDLDPKALLLQLIEERETLTWTGFKMVDDRLVLEERQIKAMLKECGTTLDYFRLIRGFRQLIQHGIFVQPTFIPLLRDGCPLGEPDGYEDRVVHVVTGRGPRSAIKRVDYLKTPVYVEFDVLVTEPNKAVHWTQAGRRSREKDSTPALPTSWDEAWQQMWRLAQELGLGANRSQNIGKFNVTRFEQTG